MTEITNHIFNKIDFYNNFKLLSQNYQTDTSMEVSSKEKVLAIIKGLGFHSKFNARGQFYTVSHEVADWTVNLNVSLKYGICELIYGGVNKKKTAKIGGPANSIFKKLEFLKGITSNDYLKNPAFSNYEELEEILKVGLDLYVELIKAIVSELNKEI